MQKLVGDPLSDTVAQCIPNPTNSSCSANSHFPESQTIEYSEQIRQHVNPNTNVFSKFIGWDPEYDIYPVVTKTKSMCCNNKVHSPDVHQIYPAANNTEPREYTLEHPEHLLRWMPESIRKTTRNNTGATCTDVCKLTPGCVAAFAPSGESLPMCTLYTFQSDETYDLPNEPSTATVKPIVDNKVFIKSFDQLLDDGWIRPLSGEDWLNVRDEWVEEACKYSAKFAGKTYKETCNGQSCTGSDQITPLTGDEKTKYINTCEQSIKNGSDSIQDYPNRNRDVGYATAVSAAINQLRANGRPGLNVTATDNIDDSVIPNWKDVIQVYTTWFPQWNTNWYSDDPSSEVLGSEVCGYTGSDETAQGDICAANPSTNASAYSPLMSFQNVCRRINGLNHDLTPIQTPEPLTSDSHWANTLLSRQPAPTRERERLLMDLDHQTTFPQCSDDTFLCQYRVQSSEPTESELRRRIHSALECEAHIRHSAYQQDSNAMSAVATVSPASREYTGTMRDDVLNVDPLDEHGKATTACPYNPHSQCDLSQGHGQLIDQKTFARRTANTCGLLVNRFIDKRGLNANDAMVDTLIASCYLGVGVKYIDKAVDNVDWLMSEGKIQHLKEEQFSADVLKYMIQGGIIAGFSLMPGVGEMLDSVALGAVQEGFQQVIGRDTANFLADKITNTNDEAGDYVTYNDAADDFAGDLASDVALAVL